MNPFCCGGDVGLKPPITKMHRPGEATYTGLAEWIACMAADRSPA